MKKQYKWLILSAMLIGLLCMFTGCARKVDVTINDFDAKIAITAKTNMTVQEVLDAANVTLAENDKVDLELDSKVSEEHNVINISRFAQVTIAYGTDSLVTEVYNGTVQDALDQAGYVLEEGQYLDVDPGEKLTDGMTIHVIQQLKVAVKADGSTQTVFTEAEDVKALLAELNISLDEDDRVTPELNTALDESVTKVVVKRVEVKEEKTQETIRYGAKTVESSRYNKGTKKITQYGQNGVKEVTYSVTYVDGKEESREVVKEEVIKEAVTEITTVGTYVAPTTRQTETTKEAKKTTKAGREVVSVETQPNPDNPEHGVKIIRYSDGTVEYIDY
ncbi:MAG: G5 domain-containing protein [Lachnospiraceae bacterium]|nr:G5 domain-containing protein [Lachnospiraceae bacterium]